MPDISKVKKLVSVLTTSMPMTGAREEVLECVLYIHYLVWFKDTNKTQVYVLINLGSEVNAIHPSFAKQLGLPIRLTDVEVQKIDGTTLDTHKIVVVVFSIVNKANRVKFFKETFVVANVSLEVVFGMPFLTLSGTNIDFLGQKLRWRTYTIEKALLTTRRVELVRKEKFVAAALDPEHETYIIHIASLSFIPLVASFSSTLLNIYPFRRPQISDLIVEKTPTKVPDKYFDFADVFSSDLASKLPEHTGINDNTIELING